MSRYNWRRSRKRAEVSRQAEHLEVVLRYGKLAAGVWEMFLQRGRPGPELAAPWLVLGEWKVGSAAAFCSHPKTGHHTPTQAWPILPEATGHTVPV